MNFYFKKLLIAVILIEHNALVIQSPFDSAEVIRKTAEAVHITVRTVRSRLLEAGLRERTLSAKNCIKEMHRANRIKFAREHIHYNLYFWRKVIWSDEKKPFSLLDDLRNTLDRLKELGTIPPISLETYDQQENR